MIEQERLRLADELYKEIETLEADLNDLLRPTTDQLLDVSGEGIGSALEVIVRTRELVVKSIAGLQENLEQIGSQVTDALLESVARRVRDVLLKYTDFEVELGATEARLRKTGGYGDRPIPCRFSAPVYSLRQAMAAADVLEVTIRNWLTRKQIPLSANERRAAGTWRLFSERDILVLALAAALNKLGVSITSFDAISGPIISDLDTYITAGTSEDAANRYVYVIWRNGDDWDVKRQSDVREMPPVTITIDLPVLVREARSRLHSPLRKKDNLPSVIRLRGRGRVAT